MSEAIIDSRDLIREREELLEAAECPACEGTGEVPEGERADRAIGKRLNDEQFGPADDEKDPTECPRCGGLGHAESADDMPEDDPDRERVEAIDELADEVGEEWTYGAALIREDAFEDHARELAESIGAISSDAAWPLSYIDWSAAASALATDYSTVEFDGETYYVRP